MLGSPSIFAARTWLVDLGVLRGDIDALLAAVICEVPAVPKSAFRLVSVSTVDETPANGAAGIPLAEGGRVGGPA